MNFKIYFVFLLLLLAIGTSACGPNQPTSVPPTATAAKKPSPTRMPLPPAVTPTIAEPTSINTPVVVASYTSKPPTDTPTVTPTGTETPTPSPTEEPTPVSANTTTMKIDWADAAGEPDLITGEDEGLYIWHEGDKVYLRGITKGNQYTFQGQANGHGAIVNVGTLGENVNVSIGDDVSRLTFAWTTVGGPDGVDFSFSGDKLLLNLGIDSIPKPEADLVFVGRDKHQVGMSIELIK